MMTKNFKYLLLIKSFFLFVLLPQQKIYPQISMDSTNYLFSNKQTHLLFQSQKHLNTLNLNTDFFYKKNFGKFGFGIDTKITTAYFLAGNESYRTARKIKVFGDYSFTSYFKSGVYITHNFFNDDKRLSISSAEVNQVMAYSSFGKENYGINFFGGFSNNLQMNNVDSGPIYGTEGFLDNYKLENQFISTKFHFSNEDISPRRNFLRNFEINVNSLVSRFFTNSIGFGYFEGRKDFYTTIDSLTGEFFNTKNNIEKRFETNYFVSEKLNFIFSKNLKIDATGRILGQNVSRQKKYVNPDYITVSSFDPKTERFVLDFSSGINYSKQRTKFFFKINYFEKEENYDVNPINGANEIFYELRKKQEERKNNLSKLAYISLGGSYDITSSDNFLITLFHRKLVYDTPSEENYDDRDELLTTLHLRYSHIFSYLFKMNFNLEGSINHVVYIFSERSSNNNVNRILRFSTEGIYSGKNVSSFNKAEVSANYTVYDFEDIIQNTQSFVYRQVLFRDSTSVSFSKQFGLKFLGYLKLAEQGQFSWNEFSEKPFQFRKEIYVEPLLLYQFWLIRIGAGIRLFSLSISNYVNNNLIPASEYLSVGPSFFAKSDLTSNLRFILHGWYEFIYTNDNLANRNLNFNLNLNWRI